jgi:uncharacterized membrane protein required for colicin V production
MDSLEIGALVVIVLVVAAWIGALLVTKKVQQASTNSPEPLALPKGSIRAILGLLIVGEFINFLLFGSKIIGDAFNSILAAFGTLAGAVTGFYFGARSQK